MEEDQLLDPVEPVPTKVVASCIGSDNQRYYKIQWSESWASEELLALKYGDLISAYWKEYEENQKSVIEEQLQESSSDPVFIGNLLSKIASSQSAENGLQVKYVTNDVAADTNPIMNIEASGSEAYNIGAFYRPVASPVAKSPTDASAAHWFNQPLRPPNLQPPKERPFHCPDCDRSYPTKLRLKDHCRKIHMNRGEYPCTLCPKVFPNKRNLQLHMDRHTGIGPHACSGCMKRFMTEQEVDHHMRSCNRLVNKEFMCDVCGKAFATKTHLAFHAKIHLPDSEKPFQCQYCSRRFSYNHDCIHHMRLHRGEKPYKCNECPMAFHRKTYLTEHMFVHTGISKHKCDECGTCYKTQQMLQTHVKNVHILKKSPTEGDPLKKRKKVKNKIRYRCDKCEKEFRFLKEYHYHKAINHRDALSGDEAKKLEFSCFEPTMVYKCKKCDKSFQWSSALKKHAETHDQNDDMAYVGDQLAEARLKHDRKRSRVRLHDERGAVRLFDDGGNTSDLTSRASSCSICQTNFADESELREHLTIEHGEVDASESGDRSQPVEEAKRDSGRRSRLVRCSLCKKTFSNAKSLQTHMTFSHLKSRGRTTGLYKARQSSGASYEGRGVETEILQKKQRRIVNLEKRNCSPPKGRSPVVFYSDGQPEGECSSDLEVTQLDVREDDTLEDALEAHNVQSSARHSPNISVIVQEDPDSHRGNAGSMITLEGQFSSETSRVEAIPVLANPPILSSEQLQAILLSGGHANVRIVTGGSGSGDQPQYVIISSEAEYQ